MCVKKKKEKKNGRFKVLEKLNKKKLMTMKTFNFKKLSIQYFI